MNLVENGVICFLSSESRRAHQRTNLMAVSQLRGQFLLCLLRHDEITVKLQSDRFGIKVKH